MKRALRCIGYVLAGIVGTVVAFGVLLAAVVLLFWLSAATAIWLDLPKECFFLFYIGFVALIAGTTVGVALCRENR